MRATLLFYTDWLDLAELITLANAHFVLVYLAAMISAVILLQGLGRWIAALGTLCCAGGFIALGSAAVYGLVVLAALIVLAPSKTVSD